MTFDIKDGMEFYFPSDDTIKGMTSQDFIRDHLVVSLKDEKNEGRDIQILRQYTRRVIR